MSETKRKTGRLGRFLAVAGWLIVVVGAGPVDAAKPVQCEVLTIQASNDKTGIDKRLKAHEAIFKQAPFSAFNSYTLVSRKTYEMPVKSPVKLTLPETLGGSLRLNKEQAGQLDLTLTLARQGRGPVDIKGKASLNAPFFAAGFKNPKGVWIFGVVCKK
jgi:hypothetical protein